MNVIMGTSFRKKGIKNIKINNTEQENTCPYRLLLITSKPI